MKPFEFCVLLFFMLAIGILCDIRNTLEKIEKNTSIVQVETKETIPPYATSTLRKETL